MVDWGFRHIRTALAVVSMVMVSGAFMVSMPGCTGVEQTVEGPDEGGRVLAPAVFPHGVHELRYQCDACHTGLFEMKRGANNITMAKIDDGELCGTCHNDTLAFGGDSCVRCHEGANPGTLIFDRVEGDTSGMPRAVFPHDTHLKTFTCDTCHDGFFKMQQGSTEISMELINQGQLCGACHNDGVAFAAINCMRCHTGP